MSPLVPLSRPAKGGFGADVTALETLDVEVGPSVLFGKRRQLVGAKKGFTGLGVLVDLLC